MGRLSQKIPENVNYEWMRIKYQDCEIVEKFLVLESGKSLLQKIVRVGGRSEEWANAGALTPPFLSEDDHHEDDDDDHDGDDDHSDDDDDNLSELGQGSNWQNYNTSTPICDADCVAPTGNQFNNLNQTENK